MKKKKTYDLICKQCGKTFQHTNPNKRYCSAECKQASKKKMICPVCGKEFIQTAPTKKYCSYRCTTIAKNQFAKDRMLEASKEEYTGIEGVDYLECKICGQRMTFFSPAHLKMHGITKEEYEAKYGKFQSYPSKYIESHFVGENNASHSSKLDEQTRKERSPFSKEFYKKRGLSEEDRNKFISSIDREYNTTLEYYINKGMTEEEAKKALTERQRTFTLEKCIEKYGEVDGRLRWDDRQDKWKLKMFADDQKICCGQSKACAKLVELILEGTDGTDVELLYGDNEFKIFDFSTVYLYDVTNVKKKKIIEFNGDLWHGNPKLYTGDQIQRVTNIPFSKVWEKDRIKKEVAEQNGFEIMVVWESDFHKNQDEIVEQCKKFIL